MVGCVPYRTRKEHYRIMRGDGLSQHPLRRHRVKNDKSTYPMGIFNNPTKGFKIPIDNISVFRRSLPNLNDFTDPNRKSGNGTKVKVKQNGSVLLEKENIEKPLSGLYERRNLCRS